MSAQPSPVLFEAVSGPPRSLSRRGLAWIAALSGAAALGPALLFVVLGAWPVLGFLGAEFCLVIGLLALHRRWSAGAVETVLLTEDRLLVRRRDGRGAAEEAVLEPYWTRVAVAERAGAACAVALVSRGRSVEIGRFLSDAERRSLAAALEGALARYRTPRFDNPQLREE